LTCISPKKCFMVFLNSPCWETHKNAINKSQKLKKRKKGGTYLPDLSSARYTSLSFFFPFGAPRVVPRCAKCQGAGKKKGRWPPWWMGGSEYEKGMGSDLLFIFPIFF
jgi:hypothetical protein